MKFQMLDMVFSQIYKELARELRRMSANRLIFTKVQGVLMLASLLLLEKVSSWVYIPAIIFTSIAAVNLVYPGGCAGDRFSWTAVANHNL